MGVRKLWFPIALAIVWVLMAAMAMADFASFDEATRALQQAVVAQPLHSARPAQGRTLRVAVR
jgi:hypothetical protein